MKFFFSLKVIQKLKRESEDLKVSYDTNLKDQNEKLVHNLEQIQADLNKKLKQQGELNDKLRMDVKKFDTDLIEAVKQVKSLEAKLAESESTGSTLSEQNKKLNELLSEKEKELDKKQSLIVEKQNKLRECEVSIEKLKKDIFKATSRNEQLENDIQYQMNQFDKMCHELEKGRVERDELNVKLRELEKNVKANQHQHQNHLSSSSSSSLPPINQKTMTKAVVEMKSEPMDQSDQDEVFEAQTMEAIAASLGVTKPPPPTTTSLRKSSRSSSKLNNVTATNAADSSNLAKSVRFSSSSLNNLTATNTTTNVSDVSSNNASSTLPAKSKAKGSKKQAIEVSFFLLLLIINFIIIILD